MPHLILSDIHANLEALEAVLVDAGPVDNVIFLGDLVGYGPNPNEVVELVRALPDLTALVGNHDLAALGEVDIELFNPVAARAARWTTEQLSAENAQYLASLPPRGVSHDFYLAHASPRDPVWEYLEDGRQGPPNFRLFPNAAALVGHTHVPRIFDEIEAEAPSRVYGARHGDTIRLQGPRRILNPGGVGQPRDGDPRAAYALLEDDRFTFRRVPYPIEETQRKIEDAGLPHELAARLAYGL